MSTYTSLTAATDGEVEVEDLSKYEVLRLTFDRKDLDFATTESTLDTVSPGPYLAPCIGWPAGSDRVHWERALRMSKV
jgi:hypothetical protein